jgi:hypothetical protein
LFFCLFALCEDAVAEYQWVLRLVPCIRRGSKPSPSSSTPTSMGGSTTHRRRSSRRVRRRRARRLLSLTPSSISSLVGNIAVPPPTQLLYRLESTVDRLGLGGQSR